MMPTIIYKYGCGLRSSKLLFMVRVIVTSSAIDKMFEIFGPIFEQNANVNFEPIFEQNVNFGPIFVKSVNFEHFVNGR